MKCVHRLIAVAVAGLLAAVSSLALAQDTGSRSGLPSSDERGKPTFIPRGAAILAEDFADITTLMGQGWVMTNQSAPIGTTGWFQGNDTVFPSQAGATTAYIGANFNNTAGVGTIDNWLITPVLPLNSLGEMSFWTRSPDGSTFPDRIEIRMNTANTGSATADFTVLLATIDPVSTAGWTQTVINSFPGATGDGRLAFRYFVTDAGPSGSNSDYIGIDSLEILGGADPALVIGGNVGQLDTCATEPANENGIIEPGETVNFVIPLNATNGAFTNVVGTLTSSTPGVTIITGVGAYGDIPDGGSADASFSVRLPETAACGSTLDLALNVTSNEGNFVLPLVRDIGLAGAFTYNGLPAAIPDNNPAGVSVTADAAGIGGPITNVQVQLDITHTWVGDIVIDLTSPDGTTVRLLDQPNVPLGTFGCSNNDINVLFADGQPDPESICSGTPPQGNTADPWPVTDASPVPGQFMADFNGEDGNGTWTLTVSDNAAGDTGTINDWSLIIEPAPTGTCTICVAGAELPEAVAVPTLGVFALGGLVALLGGLGLWMRRRMTVG